MHLYELQNHALRWEVLITRMKLLFIDLAGNWTVSSLVPLFSLLHVSSLSFDAVANIDLFCLHLSWI